VLLLGSGLMTPPLVDYLCKFGDTSITVASNILADAEKVASRHPNHMKAIFLDVTDVSHLKKEKAEYFQAAEEIFASTNFSHLEGV
jgi:alpha-aminoadipic semialdehyde synthase